MAVTNLETTPVEDWTDVLINTCKGMNGKIEVRFDRGRFHLRGCDADGPKVSFPPGIYVGVSLRDEEEVKDFLYAAYLNPEGR